jgi:subfamily B ATP-binding cassette protein MsbA
MAKKPSKFLPHFRRGLAFVWPHKKYLVFSCVAVVGISVFYTVSISSVIPFLKIMFAQYETIADWVYRDDTERRLRCGLQIDVARDPKTGRSKENGIWIREVEPSSLLWGLARTGDRIVEINGRRGDHYAMLRALSSVPRGAETTVVIQPAGQKPPQRATIRPHDGKGYMSYLAWAANQLPAGWDASSKVRTLAIVMGLLVLMQLLGGLCQFWHEYLENLISNRALIDIRTRSYTNMLRLPMSWFNQQQAGDTLSRFARDSTVFEVGVSTLLGKTMREPFKAIGVLAFAAFMDPLLLLVMGGIAPIAALFIRKLGKKIHRAQRRALVAWGALVDMLEEKIAGIRIVKGYNMERREALEFFRQHRRLMKQQLRIARIDAAISPILEVLGMMAVGGISLAGGYLVFSGRLDAEMFFAMVACIAGIFDPIRKLANVNNRLQTADAAAQRVFEIMDLPPEENLNGGGVLPDLSGIRQQIEFRDVTFAYPSNTDQPVVKGINLKVSAGEVIAIVGPNGSGKTTLCSLLMRFYQPQRGQILIDGVDIAKVSVNSLRAQIGLVTQDTVIFTDTLRANIAYGRRDATEGQVVAAARTAYVDDFVHELRSDQEDQVATGYDTVITGRSLSGGQKQRIAIARAVLRDPAILIFDEATSQIDADSEMKIQQALSKIMRGRTTFVIAHRFSTINQAQRIVVMDAGRIVAIGTHGKLVDSCPLYRTLYETQFREAG